MSNATITINYAATVNALTDQATEADRYESEQAVSAHLDEFLTILKKRGADDGIDIDVDTDSSNEWGSSYTAEQYDNIDGYLDADDWMAAHGDFWAWYN